MKQNDTPLSDIEINKKLHEMALKEPEGTLKNEIALQAIETLNPSFYLSDIYRDKGLKYDIDETFLINYISDIVSIISHSEKRHDVSLSLENFGIELSYLAFQLEVQKLLLEFGKITEEDIVF
jgi:hypothetical protein